MVLCCEDEQHEAVVCCSCAFPLPPLCATHLMKHSTHFQLPLSAADLFSTKELYDSRKPLLDELNQSCLLFTQKVEDFAKYEVALESAYNTAIDHLAHLYQELRTQLASARTALQGEFRNFVLSARELAVDVNELLKDFTDCLISNMFDVTVHYDESVLKQALKISKTYPFCEIPEQNTVDWSCTDLPSLCSVEKALVSSLKLLSKKLKLEGVGITCVWMGENRFFCCGGYRTCNHGQISRSAYFLATGREVTELPQMHAPRSHAGGFAWKGSVYVFGGSLLKTEFLRQGEKLTGLQWTLTRLMSVGRAYFTPCVLEDSAYLCGGSCVDIFHPESGEMRIIFEFREDVYSCIVFAEEEHLVILSEARRLELEVKAGSLTELSCSEHGNCWTLEPAIAPVLSANLVYFVNGTSLEVCEKSGKRVNL